jgi:hypothetical protein
LISPSLDLNSAKAAHAWLQALPQPTRVKASALAARNAVQAIDPYKRGIGFRAQVQGETGRYDTRIRYHRGFWEGSCTCPVALNCKHAGALMMEILQPATGRSATHQEEASSPAQEENAPIETILLARLEAPFAPEERRFVRSASSLYQDHRTSLFLAEYLLDPLLGKRSRWGWNSVQIWPEAPATPWQGWLYIIHYLRKHGAPIPGRLDRVTSDSEIRALVDTWERQSEVSRWKEQLASLARTATSTAAAPRCSLRLRLQRDGFQLEWRKNANEEFTELKSTPFQKLVSEHYAGRPGVEEASMPIWLAVHTGYGSTPRRAYTEPDTVRILNSILRRPDVADFVVGPKGASLAVASARLEWRVDAPENGDGDYSFSLARSDGQPVAKPMLTLDGEPALYITEDAIFEAPPLGGLVLSQPKISIPAAAIETSDGFALVEKICATVPPRLSEKVRVLKPRAVFRAELWRDAWGGSERLMVSVVAESTPGTVLDHYRREGWTRGTPAAGEGEIIAYDRSALDATPAAVDALKLTWSQYDSRWQRSVGKAFPAMFSEWLASLPPGIDTELDPELATLRDSPITARVKLDVEESGIDWFDLQIALDVTDTQLTKKELKALLDARGGFVRLGAKGWRRLQFQISEEDEQQLADLGLDARDFSGEKQRLHALQLAGKSAAKKLLAPEQAGAIERRAEEIRTRVAPEIPPAIRAELRPYQVAGFHFLAYLSANRFGGILADDMGLGKTLQTLTWLAWQRSQPGFNGRPTLVVCPKSVVDNWRSESARFLPELRVRTFQKGEINAASLEASHGECDLVVINYAQLRSLEKTVLSLAWHAAVLDEAQAIKNPESQTARVAWSINAAHRLALSGTPIENRLLDLWSIMAFAMPGALGTRATFSKSFDQRGDPLARRRLAARVRPFVIRRTKSEVARDLPERTEEDILCQLEGEQATLYRAELKRARAALLKISTDQELAKQRFNILTSLLRLRQICCHPALVSKAAAKADSAKLSALIDLLEPLIEEGHKVLIFSQFVQMLEIIRAQLETRKWPHFLLTGGTEDRGALVREFQESPEAAAFLISLRAGGFGLNLTAASYVVLFDPWWNPAVENQAIDRTHRIGQVNHVIAYRLLIKDSIEEKIRGLQRQKSALAADILGEENFTRALTLDDFRFLLGADDGV